MTQPRKPKPKPDSKQLAQQVVLLTEALQRERADADNIRRRHDEQIGGLKDMVKANVIHELLPVIDNFDRALKQVEPFSELAVNKHELAKPEDKLIVSMQNYIKGIRAIVKQFEKTLMDMGVERIKTVGEVFNPNLHEAVHMEEDDPSASSGQVVEVVSEELQPGYKLGDEVIRYAMVKVKMEQTK